MDALEQAEMIGLSKGISQGISQGKFDDVITMYDDGVSIENISKWTKLSISTIHEALEDRLAPHHGV
jgi:hypothetical protein